MALPNYELPITITRGEKPSNGGSSEVARMAGTIAEPHREYIIAIMKLPEATTDSTVRT